MNCTFEGKITESMKTNFLWADCQNILCVRSGGLGDVLMLSPAIRALKEAHPGRRITLLTSSAGASIARYIPSIDNIITSDELPCVTEKAQEQKSVHKLINILRKRRFGAAVLFTRSDQNPLPLARLCCMAGIPHMLGYCQRTPGALLDYGIADKDSETRHEVERQLNLVATVGCSTSQTQLSLSMPPEATLQALETLAQAGMPPYRPWIIIHTGMRTGDTQYPARDYVKAAWQLIHEMGYQIILTGSLAEREYLAELSDDIGPGAWNLAGQLPLDVFCALTSQASVLISDEVDPVHIAAAAGTPVVALCPETQTHFQPWLVPSRMLQITESLTTRSAEPPASQKTIASAVEELVGVADRRSIVRK